MRRTLKPLAGAPTPMMRWQVATLRLRGLAPGGSVPASDSNQNFK